MSNTGTLRLLYFAWLRERLATSGETVALPDGVATVGDLLAWQRGRGPAHAAAFATTAQVRCAVNQEFVRPDAPVSAGDEVAFFPSRDRRLNVATVRVQEADFDLGAEVAALAAGRTDIGGIGCFVGTVRAGHSLAAMTLEHYPGVTERAMARIAATAEQRFSLLGCTLVHRVGRLLPGENIVLVAVAAAHAPAGAGWDRLPDRLATGPTKAPSWPGASRPSTRSRAANVARSAPTPSRFCQQAPRSTAWMAGTSPAMTNPRARYCRAMPRGRRRVQRTGPTKAPSWPGASGHPTTEPRGECAAQRAAPSPFASKRHAPSRQWPGQARP